MPITARYHVQCDTCWGHLGDDYTTPEAADQARHAAGWAMADGSTACPDHGPA